MTEQESSKLKVRYENTTAVYANQIVLSANREDLILDFSSGTVPDPNTGDPVLPVHTRVALSWAGASRLRTLLDKALQRQAESGQM
jgi:hypothetical protein